MSNTEKSTDDKVAELTAELQKVKERLDKSEKRIAELEAIHAKVHDHSTGGALGTLRTFDMSRQSH